MTLNTYLFELRLRRALGRFRPLDAPVLALDELRVAYIPVPKAANTSVRSALMASIGREDIVATGVHRSTRSLLQPSTRFFAKDRKDWFIFTVVRDPTARALSAWRNKLIDPDEVFRPLQRMGVKEKLSFEEFLRVCSDWPDWALNDHFMPQSLYLSKVLDRPDLNILHVETLAQDWPRVREVLRNGGADPRESLGVHNTSRSTCDTDLTPGARRLLNQVYDKDYKRFGYTRP
jgi:hypothetical protein